MTCAAPGCSHAARARGLCMAHYQRLYRSGVVEPRAPRLMVSPAISEPSPPDGWWPCGRCEMLCPPTGIVCRTCRWELERVSLRETA